MQYMLRTGCSWNILCTAVCVCVFVTFVANRPFGGLGVEGRIILRRVLNRNDSEWFGVPQDGISHNPLNDNRP